MQYILPKNNISCIIVLFIKIQAMTQNLMFLGPLGPLVVALYVCMYVCM